MPRIHILKGFSGIDGALWVLAFHPRLPSRQDMALTASQNGFTVTNKRDYDILQLLGEWGLADIEKRQFTSRGKEFYSLWERKRDIAIDVLHGLQYGLWTKHVLDQNLASWAYQKVCNYLWEYQTLPKPQDLIAYVYEMREELGEGLGNIANAFSSKSINGACDWLLPLKPLVLEGVKETTKGRNFTNATFTQRSHCSTALFLMGLDWVARESGNVYGDLWRIQEEQRQQVCRFCLIDETRFDFMFNETLRRFSDYLSVRRSGGLYVIINNEPQLSDF